MPSVLFVCMANRFRSPWQPPFSAAPGGERDGRFLAGLQCRDVGRAGPAGAGDGQRNCRPYGMDLSDHRSRRVDRQLLAEHDLVLVMQASQREALLTEFPEFEGSIDELSWVAECRTYDIPDLSASGEDVAEIAAGLDDLLRCGFAPICKLAASLYNIKSRTGPTEGLNTLRKRKSLAAYEVDKYLLAMLLSGGEAGWIGSPCPRMTGARSFELSEGEGVGPQLYWILSKSEKLSLLPKACQDRLRAMFAATRLNNLQILDELEKLTARFSQQGIPVVALKGICFALTIYPDIGMRPMGDLDLLVPASRLKDAIQIANDLGYEKALPEATPGLDELLNHAACLAKTGSPFTILELHHTLVGEETFQHAVPVDWFWTQTEPLTASVEWKADNLLMLTPTAQLLYACAHAMLQHGGRNASLRWMYDLDRLVRVHADRLDWPLFLPRRGRSSGARRLLQLYSKATSLFRTPVPQATLLGAR